MANLFPSGSLESVTAQTETTVTYRGTYDLDFETMEFIKNPDGTIKILSVFEAYLQWCQLAMMTARYKFRAYSSKFGRDALTLGLDKKAIELELIRITTETLLVHPLTDKVDNFEFTWENNEVTYTYNVATVQGQSDTLTSTEKVG